MKVNSLSLHLLLAHFPELKLRGESLAGLQDLEINALAMDSRLVKPGSLLAIFPDTHPQWLSFVERALAAGVTALFLEEPFSPELSALLAKASTRSAPLAVLAAPSGQGKRLFAELTHLFYGVDPEASLLVGVTGTNGKTTTTHLISEILWSAGVPTGLSGTFGYGYRAEPAYRKSAYPKLTYKESGFTTPTILGLTQILEEMQAAQVAALVMEVSSHALALERVAGLSLAVGVFLNLTHDHLDFHGDLEHYLQAKLKLFREYMHPAGYRVVNLDDPLLRETLKREPELFPPAKLVTFSKHSESGATICLQTLEYQADGLLLTIKTPLSDYPVVTLATKLVGAFNVENILAAVGVSVALEYLRRAGDVGTFPALKSLLTKPLVERALEEGIANTQVAGRLEKITLTAGEGDGASLPSVYVDYAHTPDALTKALEALRPHTPGRLICVFGCGGDRDPLKRKPMGLVAGTLADLVIVTNDNPRSEEPEGIAKAIVEGLAEAARQREVAGRGKLAYFVELAYLVELDRRAAIKLALTEAKKGDTVLIAGKGHEDYQLTKAGKEPFKDSIEAEKVLRALLIGNIDNKIAAAAQSVN